MASTQNETINDDNLANLSPELAKEIRLIRRNQLAADIINRIIKYGSFVLIIYWITDAATVFAGKTTYTYINVATKMMANLSMDKWFAYLFGLLFGGSGFTLYRRERKLRKNKVKYLSDRIKKLELEVDPDRTSSEITPTGETKEGD